MPLPTDKYHGLYRLSSEQAAQANFVHFIGEFRYHRFSIHDWRRKVISLVKALNSASFPHNNLVDVENMIQYPASKKILSRRATWPASAGTALRNAWLHSMLPGSQPLFDEVHGSRFVHRLA